MCTTPESLTGPWTSSSSPPQRYFEVSSHFFPITLYTAGEVRQSVSSIELSTVHNDCCSRYLDSRPLVFKDYFFSLKEMLGREEAAAGVVPAAKSQTSCTSALHPPSPPRRRRRRRRRPPPPPLPPCPAQARAWVSLTASLSLKTITGKLESTRERERERCARLSLEYGIVPSEGAESVLQVLTREEAFCGIYKCP